MVNLFLDGSSRDESVNGHRLELADAVGPFARLGVRGGVPVRVEDDDAVRAREVDAETARLGRKQHAEDVRGRVELEHQRNALPHVRCTVKPAVREALCQR